MREIHKRMMWLSIPLIGMFLLFYVVPYAISIYYSLIESAFVNRFVGFANYLDVLGNRYFRLALRNTLEFALIGVPGLMAVSIIFALSLYNLGDKHEMLRGSFIMPMLLPTAAVVLVFRLFLANTVSPLFTSMRMLGLSDSQIYRLPIFGLFIWRNSGFNIILIMAALVMIPYGIMEAAMIDGAGKFRRLIYITLPMIKHTLFFVMVMSMIQSFRVFKEAYLLYGAYPDASVYTVQHYMNNQFYKLNYQKLTSGALVFALMVLVIVAIFYRIERRMDLMI